MDYSSEGIFLLGMRRESLGLAGEISLDVLPQRRVSAQGAVGTSVVELEAHFKYVQNPYSQEHRGIYDESGPLQHIDPSVWTMGYYFKLQVFRMDTGQQGLAKGLKLRGMKPK